MYRKTLIFLLFSVILFWIVIMSSAKLLATLQLHIRKLQLILIINIEIHIFLH